MNVQSVLHTIDGISTWVGKAAAWLIIGLMTVVCVEVFKRYIMNMPTAWIFDVDNMLYGTLFMLCGAYTLAQNAHVRGDFLYSSMRPRTQAALDLVLYLVFFIPGIAALIFAGYYYAGELLAHRRAFQRHGQRPAGLSLQVDDPDRRRAGDAAGHRRNHTLPSSASRPANGRAASRTWPRSTSSRSNSRTASTSTRNRARSRSSARTRSTKRRVSAAWAETSTNERSRTRPFDARPHRGRHHDGVPDGLHADGPRHVLRLHRLLRPHAAVHAQQGVRPDGPAHLRCDDQRRAHLDPVVRADGIRDGARRAGRQDVLLDPARVPARPGLAGRRHADRVHVLGHRLGPGGRGGGADGRHRLQPDAQGGLRRQARLWRHHGRRHARHPDPAVGDDHRLRGRGRPIGREALRRRDVPGLLPVVPLSHLHHRLGDDQSEDRATAAGRADQGSGAGLDAEVSGGLFQERVRGAADRLGFAGAGEGDRDRTRSRQLRDAAQELRRIAGAVHAGRRHAAGWCGGTSSFTSRRLPRWSIRACSNWARRDWAAGPRRRPNRGRPRASTFGSASSPRSARCSRSATTPGSTPTGSRSSSCCRRRSCRSASSRSSCWP